MAELSKNYVTQYSRNVYTLAQQKGSRLRPFVTVVPLEGEKRTFDRVKPTSAVRIESRYSDTQLIHTEFDRRTVWGFAYGWSDLIDWQDKLDLLLDPTSDVVASGGYALGRVIDDIIIENAFDGVAYEGKEGITQVALPNSQKIPVTWGGSGENEGLTVEKILEVRSRFGNADIDLDDPANKVYMAITQTQLDDLARGVEVRSRDYDALQALLKGVTSEFLGIHFVRTGRLKATAADGGKSRLCAAWCKSGIVLAMQKEMNMSIFTNHDKWDSWQALATVKAGATRIEDAKLLQVFCYEKN
ncbi:MAG: hypothetical protein IJW08_05345 [Lentisphaeria bacterium]|nr:hypothetical protein [Lentisphaeria bacterium]